MFCIDASRYSKKVLKDICISSSACSISHPIIVISCILLLHIFPPQVLYFSLPPQALRSLIDLDLCCKRTNDFKDLFIFIIVLLHHIILSPEGASSWQDLVEGQPTLLKLMPRLGLDTQRGMDLLCLAGMVIAFFCVVSRTARDFVSFTLLWMLYLSLYQVKLRYLCKNYREEQQ